MKWTHIPTNIYHTADCFPHFRIMANESSWIVRIGLNQVYGKGEGLSDCKAKAKHELIEIMKVLAAKLRTLE